MATILLLGGTGYIGSHVAYELLSSDHDVILFDNLANSKDSVKDRVIQLTNKPCAFIKGDIRDSEALDAAFEKHKPDLVILLAGLKAVGESTSNPGMYYKVNVVGALEVLETMVRHRCPNLVFSSSATVYGNPEFLPLTEDHPVGPTNPYGQTKAMIERITTDFVAAHPYLNVINLRYFNPVGAHRSGLLGEDPNGIPNNLFPYIAKVASKELDCLQIYGNDYPTKDGTGERDYIHVTDLAKGHLAAADKLLSKDITGIANINLGTGKAYSVLEVLSEWSRIVGRELPFRFASRRAGDVATCYADPKSAEELLGWQARMDLHSMCSDHWNWQINYSKMHDTY